MQESGKSVNSVSQFSIASSVVEKEQNKEIWYSNQKIFLKNLKRPHCLLASMKAVWSKSLTELVAVQAEALGVTEPQTAQKFLNSQRLLPKKCFPKELRVSFCFMELIKNLERGCKHFITAKMMMIWWWWLLLIIIIVVPVAVVRN